MRRLRLGRVGAVGEAVDAQGIVEHAGHRGARIERGERLLEHHLEARPQQPQRFAARGEQVAAVEADRAAIGLDEPHDDAGKRRLAAARRPDQRQRLAARQIERDVVERRDLAPAAAERFRDAAQFEQRGSCRRSRCLRTRGTEASSRARV